jgi:hypothetical protein
MLIKSRYEISLVCDWCEVEDQWETLFHGATKAQCLSEIKRARWLVRHDGITLCDRCNYIPENYKAKKIKSLKLTLKEILKETP